MTLVIEGGNALIGGALVRTDIVVSEAGIEPGGAPQQRLDASGLLVLPGIVDIHGDAFERQIAPRPGVHFPLDLALAETDRQLIANGITTACHAVTSSWEPGLRSASYARALVERVHAMRNRFVADTLVHLRHETYSLDAEAEVAGMLEAGLIHVLAFNDHMADTMRTTGVRSTKLAKMVERTGLSTDDFIARAAAVAGRRDEVPASITRLAAVARHAGIPILSHDDRHIEDRRFFRALGSTVAEFPKTEPAAVEAIGAGEHVVFGAPNVVRGGSHTDCPSATDMVRKGLCTILASDYYYPALSQAPAILAAEDAAGFAEAWALVSANPAMALGLADRGTIAAGKRGDLVIAALDGRRLDIIATIARGRIVHLTDWSRLSTSGRLAAQAA